MSYKTSQKQAILDYISAVKNHPTAQEVFEGVKAQLPSIGSATVYRNLAALAEEGKISEIQVDKIKRYEAATHTHQHFICEKCNRIIDMELSALLNIDEAVKKMKCHIVHNYNLELIGLCASCK